MRVIIDQKKSVSEVTRMIGNIDQTGPIPGILADLKSLQASYDALTIDDQIKEGKAHLVLTDKTLEAITKTVEKLRTDIVQ
jgi:hypothetical protein